MKALSLVGHGKVPRGCGFRTGDPRDTEVLETAGDLPAEHGKNRELAEPQISICFFSLRYSTLDWPDWEKGGRKDCVCLLVV